MIEQDIIDWFIQQGIDIQSAYCRGGRHVDCPVVCACKCHRRVQAGQEANGECDELGSPPGSCPRSVESDAGGVNPLSGLSFNRVWNTLIECGILDINPQELHPSQRERIRQVISNALAAVERQTWETAIAEVELVKLVHAENESMAVGFICAKNSCLANLRRRAA